MFLERRRTSDLWGATTIEAGYGPAKKAVAISRELTSGKVYLPYVPASNQDKVLARVGKFKEEGGLPSSLVVHLPARRFENVQGVKGYLSRLSDEGVRNVLLIGGDDEVPKGQFSSAGDLLKTGILPDHGITGVGFAAHPEAHPRGIPKDVLDRALKEKLAVAEAQGLDPWVITQAASSSRATLDLISQLRKDGVEVPIQAGVFGPATFPKMFEVLQACGMWDAVKSQGLLKMAKVGIGMRLGNAHRKVFSDVARANESDPSFRAGVHFFVLDPDMFSKWMNKSKAQTALTDPVVATA